MLVRALETLLVTLVNRAHQVREKRAHPLPTPPPDDGSVRLGHLLSPPALLSPSPWEVAPPSVFLSPAERRRHLYVLGATGTGKTNLLLRLIESDIAARRAFCVVDLRGDLVDRILLRLTHHSQACPPKELQKTTARETPEALGERLLLLDLRQTENAVAFNPLLGSGDMHARAYHLLGVLREQADSWGIQLEETLRNALLALAETGGSLLDIEPLLSSAPFRAQVLAGVTDSSVRSFFARYGQLSEDKQIQWRLPVLNKVTPLLAIPRLRRLLGQRRSFSFDTLLNKTPGQIILISLAVDRLHQASYLVGSLLLSAFQNSIMARVDQPEEERVPVHLYVDEFETMATPQFEAILAEGRRFGLGLCLSHQNLTQLPSSLRSVLLTNAHTQFYFQTGAADAGELAREVVSEQSPADVRQCLLSQGVGQTYLVRRGEAAVRLQVERCPAPPVDSGVVQAIRAASFARFARPCADVDAELAAREAIWYPAPAGDFSGTSSSTVSSAAPPTKRGAKKVTPTEQPLSPLLPEPPAPAATYQIRHDKISRFAPLKHKKAIEPSMADQASVQQPAGPSPDSFLKEEP